MPEQATVPLFGQPAGFWIRFLAWLIDGTLLAVVSTILERRLGIKDVSDAAPLQEILANEIPRVLLAVGIGALYSTIFIGSWGATLGKMALGLRVIRMDGKLPTYGLSFMRSVAEFFSVLPLCLGYIWIALSPSKRAWHDYLCDTRVVHKKPPK